MQHSTLDLMVAPFVGWLAVVSILVVAYLAMLEFEQRRRNRRMDEQRQRLGLRRA